MGVGETLLDSVSLGISNPIRWTADRDRLPGSTESEGKRWRGASCLSAGARTESVWRLLWGEDRNKVSREVQAPPPERE
jgi:hypothetical protein